MSAEFLTTQIERTNEVYLCDKRSVGSSRSSKPLDLREPIVPTSLKSYPLFPIS